MGRQRLFVTGETEEQKFDSIERALQRLNRRARKTVAAAVTPFPVSSFVEAPDKDGVVFRHIFPLHGRIIKAYVLIEGFPKGGVRLTAEMKGGSQMMAREFTLLKVPYVQALEIDAMAGACLMLRVSPMDPNLEVSHIWVGIVWAPLVSDAVLKDFILDELEKQDAKTKEG